MSKHTHYQILLNETELQKYLDTLPELQDDEVFYLSLLARAKWVKDTDLKIHGSSNKLVRTTCTKDNIVRRLREMEVPMYTYELKGQPIPQEALGVYISVNPVSKQKAARTLLKRLTEWVVDNPNHPINVLAEAATALQTSQSRKVFLDLDIDAPDEDSLFRAIRHVYDNIALDALTTVRTRGGAHVRVRLDQSLPFFKENRNWHRTVVQQPDVIAPATILAQNDGLIPLPGCTQGGYQPFVWHILNA
jgi:hypothetical protein